MTQIQTLIFAINGHKMGHTSTCLPRKVNVIMTFKPNEKRSKCVQTAVIPYQKKNDGSIKGPFIFYGVGGAGGIWRSVI